MWVVHSISAHHHHLPHGVFGNGISEPEIFVHVQAITMLCSLCRSGSRPDSRQQSSDEESDGTPAPLLGKRLSEGFIPDAATIHAVRKKRERARQLGGRGAEYIPLEESRKPNIAAGKSRLIREDEHDRYSWADR